MVLDCDFLVGGDTARGESVRGFSGTVLSVTGDRQGCDFISGLGPIYSLLCHDVTTRGRSFEGHVYIRPSSYELSVVMREELNQFTQDSALLYLNWTLPVNYTLSS